MQPADIGIDKDSMWDDWEGLADLEIPTTGMSGADLAVDERDIRRVLELSRGR